MDMNTPQVAGPHAWARYRGAGNFERVTLDGQTAVGWTFLVPGRYYGWLLDDGTLSDQLHAWRWWAYEDALTRFRTTT